MMKSIVRGGGCAIQNEALDPGVAQGVERNMAETEALTFHLPWYLLTLGDEEGKELAIAYITILNFLSLPSAVDIPYVTLLGKEAQGRNSMT
jgi:hypothetical protein